MIYNILDFFNEIKVFNSWDKLWKKKITMDEKGLIQRICERKFRDQEVKEIIKNPKNNIISIKEYRYNEEGYLNKVLCKTNNGSIKYINEIVYDGDYNIITIKGYNFEEELKLLNINDFDEKQRLIKEELLKHIGNGKYVTMYRNIHTYDFQEQINGEIPINNYNVVKECLYDLEKNIVEYIYKDTNGTVYGDIGYGFRDMINERYFKDIEITEKISFLDLIIKEDEKARLNYGLNIDDKNSYFANEYIYD